MMRSHFPQRRFGVGKIVPRAKRRTLSAIRLWHACGTCGTYQGIEGENMSGPVCYSVTVFTDRWKELRDFYKEILGARIVSERAPRYCDMVVGGLPICLRSCESGEAVSYFQLYLCMPHHGP